MENKKLYTTVAVKVNTLYLSKIKLNTATSARAFLSNILQSNISNYKDLSLKDVLIYNTFDVERIVISITVDNANILDSIAKDISTKALKASYIINKELDKIYK